MEFRSLFLFELEVDPCIQYRPLTLRGAGRESRWSDRGEEILPLSFCSVFTSTSLQDSPNACVTLAIPTGIFEHVRMNGLIPSVFVYVLICPA